jgi:hypothetical protein
MCRRRAVVSLLIAVAVWPIVHHALARTVGIHPWKFFGWAMYATPPRVSAEVTAFTTSREPIALRNLSADTVAVVDRIRTRAAIYGRFVSTKPLAAALFAELPTLDGVTVVVRVPEAAPLERTFRREQYYDLFTARLDALYPKAP